MIKALMFIGFLLGAVAPATAAEQSASPASNRPLSFLKGLIAESADEPLDPEKAFAVSVVAVSQDELAVRFAIDGCCYLYRDKIGIELAPGTGGAALPEGVRLGPYQLPAGKAKADEFLGRVEVYEKPFELRVPITNLAQASGAVLKVSYQGCAETPVAVCYAPTTQSMTIAQPGTGNAADSKLIVYILGAFGVGLLLTFTPCVLPMVPILSSAIVGSGEKRLTKLEGGLLSYSYVLGTAVTYTVAGAIAGVVGVHLQAYFQNPWAIGLFTAILVLLALSMFGFYKLEIPSAIQSFLHHHGHHIHQRSRRVPGGTYVGVFVLGIVSALIIGACATPFVAGALGAAMESRDPVLGATVMFTLAHGQGLALVALGVGAGFLLPKVGPWMETIKHVSGALLIAVAIYLLGTLPEIPVLLLWGVFFIVCGVYLGATQRLPDSANGWRYLWKGLGTVLLIWGVVALLGGFAGNRDALNPLPLQFLGSAGVDTESKGNAEVRFTRVHSVSDLERHLALAKTAGKPVFIEYFADWCTDCVRMDGTTFRDPQVGKDLEPFVVLRADVTETDSAATQSLKKRFGVYAPPAMVLIDATGQQRGKIAYGYQSAGDLLALLRRI